MRKRVRRIVLALAAFILGTAQIRPVPAPSDPFPAPNIVVPQHRVIHCPHPRVIPRVRLEAVEAEIRIVEQVASTSLRVTLVNDGHRIQEAQLLVPVPSGAVVRGFELEGLGESGIARILPRDQARRIYDDIVRRIKDPGLLEFAGYNLIRSSVFPVPAHGAQTIRLVYESVLSSRAGRVDYVLPRSEALDAGGVKWSLSVDIRSADAISTAYSPSHEIETDRIGDGEVRIDVPRASIERGAGSFRLSYLLDRRRSGTLPATLLAYPDATVARGDGGYFLFLAGLPAGRPAGQHPVRREVIIAIDRSGSMRGAKLEQAREAAVQVLEALDDGEAFNILDYATSVESFSSEPVAKSPRTIAQARDYLSRLRASGGTAIHDAIVEAVRQPSREGVFPVVLFLTDGLATVGERSEIAIRQAAKRSNRYGRRIFTFGVGYDVNVPLLTQIALSSRAKSTFVLPEEDVEVKVGEVFRGLSGPVLAGAELEVLDSRGGRTTRAVREVMPAALPDLFEGDQLVLLGQYTEEGPIRFRLTGDYFGRRRELTFDLDTSDATTRNSFVPRIWASRKIAALMDEIRAMGAGSGTGPGRPSSIDPDDPRLEELVDEIVRLSTRWGVLSEYTAFLATEDPPREWRHGEPRHLRGLREHFAGDAEHERSGSPAAVGHEINLDKLRSRKSMEARRSYVDSDLKKIETTAIRQAGDRTLYRRSGRWVEAALLDRAGSRPEAVIEFGTPEFAKLVDKLAKDGRQAVLALGGNVYLLLDGKRVLVRMPGSGS
jgi:Ca-activated chloride channel family protein